MRILCTGDGTYTGADLEVGRYYEAAPADTATEAQNRAFHALLQEFYASNLHSYEGVNFEQFRNCIKRDLGAGNCGYEYMRHGERGWEWETAATWGEMLGSGDILYMPNGKPVHKPVLKSWSKYTKKERRETIDRLISVMIQAGANSKKFDEIIQGMNGGES
jgi:hypothetical protein